jgi:hypothetical protein
MTIKVRVHGSFLDVHVTEDLTMDDLPVLLDAMDHARQAGPFVLLTDTTQMNAAPRPVISAFADRLKKLPSMKQVWLGDAVVISSPVVRFVVSTLIMIAPLPTAVKVFEGRDEALEWCGKILERARLPVPPQLRKSA